MTFPKGLTITGVVLAVAMVFVDPANVPFVAQLFGEHAAEKIAAVGAIIAALGRALLDRAAPTVPTVPTVPPDAAP